MNVRQEKLMQQVYRFHQHMIQYKEPTSPPILVYNSWEYSLVLEYAHKLGWFVTMRTEKKETFREKILYFYVILNQPTKVEKVKT